MKNKSKFFIHVFVASIMVVGASVMGYGRFYHKTSNLDLILDENIEALSGGEGNATYYSVHHMKYVDPVTNFVTQKCTAFSYVNAYAGCTMPHNHGAEYCCSVNCY